MKNPVQRTIRTSQYTPSAERTDDGAHGSGDVTYVWFVECDHVVLGNPTMTYRAGDTCACWACAGEDWAYRGAA